MVKKAFIKTLEILFVIIISVFFLVAVIPRQYANFEKGRTSYLLKMENDEEFRTFVTANNVCFNSSQDNVATRLTSRYLPGIYSYIICTGPSVSSLPPQDISVDTLFFAGNYSSTNFKILKLYYWTS
ncbi:MAG: hypothetical protein ABIJ34_01775 [archaeon]